MPWNWQLHNWPQFKFDLSKTAELERVFLLKAGQASGCLSHIEHPEYAQWMIEIMSQEGVDSSKIEGEILNRESLQSSIKQHFGLKVPPQQKGLKKEAGMADLLFWLYTTYDKPLTHEMLWHAHALLFKNREIEDLGAYRSHQEAMQIISNRYHDRRVYFEAPPSAKVRQEMESYIRWFNASKSTLPILARSAIAHIYFESIHPFTDGNGRIGRILSEKVICQEVGRGMLIAISQLLEKRKKEYYLALQHCNNTLEISAWIEFFSNMILEAQDMSLKSLHFTISKSKMMHQLQGKINPRQEKVLLRMFAEGVFGFKGGLSAEKYIAITKTSRATATRDLAELVQLEALIKTGELRYTRYSLNLY